MYCVHVFAIVYVFVCTIVVCGCICLYVYVPPMRKSGYADHCEVKSSINQSINQSPRLTQYLCTQAYPSNATGPPSFLFTLSLTHLCPLL